MATQAKITFKALNGEARLSERTLTLHPHLRTIQIGRASKTPSKGLQAAADNAWFDSPVMSRNHAEISLDSESNVITIRDIGSMHGTFVNDSQLRRHEPHGLGNDDIIVFGAEVKRNLDTFSARAFRVNYEFLPFKANISYAFPGSDDEDYEISEDDMEESEEPSSEDGVSIESPPHKASQAIHAIDLTRDDSPASSSVVEVEIAGETSAEKDLMNIMAGQPADIDHSAEPVSIATCAGNPPILVDSDDEDTRFSSDSDDQSDEVEYDDGASAGGDSMDEQDSENEDGGDHEMDIEEEASPEPRDFPEKELENASGLASLGLYTFLNQPIPESNVRNIIDASETILEEEDHDDESDFGLSDAGAEGIRALFDEGLVDNAGDPYFEDGINEEIGSESVIACEAPTKAPTVDEKLETPKHVTFAFLPSEQLPEMTSSYSHFNAFTRSSQTDDSPSQTIMNARQPSPSDAAMVKTAIPSTTTLNDSANPIQVHHLPSQDFQKLTAQSLGDKTGKHAFFAAREDNKAKIYGAEHENPGSSSFQTANTGSSVTLEDRRQRSIIAMEKFREKKRRMEEEAKTMLSEPAKIPVPSAAARAVDFTILPLATLPYLDDHTQAPKAIRTPSPEPDMTSAVTYNESKASMAFANKHSFNPSGRSGLSINDIIEDAAGDHASKILKRKADGISEAIENEIRVWATSSSALDNIEESTAISASASQDALRGEQSEAPPTPVANTPEQRPAKRLRKIVESVGYVALGGATLFGALILSAPDFL